jgi:hypothetical protein
MNHAAQPRPLDFYHLGDIVLFVLELAPGEEHMIRILFAFLLTLGFIVMALHDLVDIPGLTHGKQVRAAIGPWKLWVGTIVNATLSGLPAGFAIYYWNRPAPASVANYWLIFCGIAMTGAIAMWWMPYFFGTSAKTRKLYAEMYAGTWQILPPRGDNRLIARRDLANAPHSIYFAPLLYVIEIEVIRHRLRRNINYVYGIFFTRENWLPKVAIVAFDFSGLHLAHLSFPGRDPSDQRLQEHPMDRHSLC